MKQLSLFNISRSGYGGVDIQPAKYPHVLGFKGGTTSKSAAEKVKSKAEAIRETIKSLYESGFKGTADDVCAELFGDDIEMKFTVRPRVSELSKQGFLRESGIIKDGKQVMEWAK